MSSEPTPVTTAHFDYVRAHTTAEDEFLRELKRAAADAGLPKIWISPEQGAFMQTALRVARAREVVEVGTLGGYSAIWMARGLPAEGRVRTVELEPAHADFAERWISKSDAADRVEVLRGDGREVLPRLAANSADACFIDADKESYGIYLDECLRIVRPGGLLMVDNAFAFGGILDPQPDDEVRAIAEFNDRLAADPRVQAIITPFGDGCWFGVRLASAAAAS